MFTLRSYKYTTFSLSLFVGILLGCCLCFAVAPRAVHSQEAVQIYSVAVGDTLGLIADRFGLSLEELANFNGITDPNLIQVGQELRIPSGEVAPGLVTIPLSTVHALPGETLAMLASRFVLDPLLISALNNISDTARLYPGQFIRVPAEDAPSEPLRMGAITDIQLPNQLVQGETGRFYITSSRPLSLTATWNGLPLTLSPPPSTKTVQDVQATAATAEQFTLLPVPALLAPQRYSVVLTYTTRSGFDASRSWLVEVMEGPYESAQINLPPATAQLLAPETVEDEINKLWEVWSNSETLLQWSDVFTRPLESQYLTTSPFGTRRSYNGGPYSSYHSGQDFGAPIGTPIRAPAAGVIALAEPLNVRGNAVLIDHGRGIYTGYWHLNEIQVAVGQPVSPGDIIGLVGTTGLSTGAHLHWELRIYGIGVNPMQFLDEPLLP